LSLKQNIKKRNSFENFPESLNSYGVLISMSDVNKGESTFRHLIKKFPDYKDAIDNYYNLKKGRLNKLKHTIYLMPQTLNFFLYYYR